MIFPGKEYWAKAKRKLDQASLCAQHLGPSYDGVELLLHWENFVNNWNVARKFALQAADRAENSALANKLRHAEKDDELVRFLFHARNCEWYGVEATARPVQCAVNLTMPGGFNFGIIPNSMNVGIDRCSFGGIDAQGKVTQHFVRQLLVHSGNIYTDSQTSVKLSAEPIYVLNSCPAKNRDVTYLPPREANGDFQSAEKIAISAIEWLDAVILDIKTNRGF